MKITDKHVLFFSWKDMFSNHYRSSVPFSLPSYEREGIKFFTGEHFMMYEKAMLFGDKEVASEIMKAWKPQDAKLLGRKVKGFDQGIWEENRERIMNTVVYCRIVYDKPLRIEAISHRLAGRSFVEASPWDKIWGVGMGEGDPGVDNPENWKGLNLLGKAWDSAVDALVEKCGGYETVRKEW